MNTIIATEGGRGIGYGHQVRCGAIADALQTMNAVCEMVLYDATTGQDNWHKNRELIFGQKADTLLVDSYLADASFYEEAKEVFQRVVVIDDFNRLTYDADILINPSIYGCEIDYKNQNAKILCGMEFVILRDEIRSKKRKKGAAKDIKKIAITVGGSDKFGLLPRVIKMLEGCGYELSVIAGSEEYAKTLSQSFDNLKIFGYLNASKMCELFLSSDVAISGCGQTLNELAYLGVPTIGIAIANDQFLNARNYHKIGFLKQEIFVDDELEKSIKDALSTLAPPEVRQSISSLEIISGNGAQNIAKELL